MEFSPRAAELTTLLESRITNFYTNFQVDEILQGIIDLHHDIFFFLILILVLCTGSWFVLYGISIIQKSNPAKDCSWNYYRDSSDHIS